MWGMWALQHSLCRGRMAAAGSWPAEMQVSPGVRSAHAWICQVGRPVGCTQPLGSGLYLSSWGRHPGGVLHHLLCSEAACGSAFRSLPFGEFWRDTLVLLKEMELLNQAPSGAPRPPATSELVISCPSSLRPAGLTCPHARSSSPPGNLLLPWVSCWIPSSRRNRGVWLPTCASRHPLGSQRRTSWPSCAERPSPMSPCPLCHRVFRGI